MRWQLDEYDRRGGIGGEGVKNLLEASGFATRDELLVREALQNSVDAHDDVAAHKVRVVFRKVTLRGKEKQKFVDLMGLKEFGDISPLIKGTPNDSPLRTLDAATPLDLLYIEDFNTVGLGGGFPDTKGNFYRLLFLIGDAKKVDDGEDEGGGSYGYGKAVYASNSAASTIVAFSVFSETPSTAGAFARLLGSSFHKAFDHKGVSYTGRGWFGKAKQGDRVPDPYTNDEALDLAVKLGFAKRTKNDFGTSILIIGTKMSGVDLSIDNIRAAIETWWWPRYIEDRLDIELYDGETRCDPPRPKARPDLMPFIDCFNALASGEHGNGQEVQIVKFAPHSKTGHPFGTIALKAVKADFPEKASNEPGPGSRRVALMRGPNMVVEYDPLGSEKKEPFVGVYRAPSELNLFLKLAEPKEHDKWDPKARRLGEQPHGPEVVDKLLLRCREEVRRFQASLAPKKELPRDRLEALDRLLGAAFTSRPEGEGGRKTDIELGVVDLEQTVRRIRQGGTVRVEAELKIRLKNSVKAKSPQWLKVKPEIAILEDASKARGRDPEDLLELELFDDHGKELAKRSRQPTSKLRVSKDDWTVLRIKSAPYKADWVSQLQVEVE